jgi:SSS family solute:Na+ symporter
MALLTTLFLLAYLAAVLAFGFAWRRRAGRDETSYFAADRSLTTFWGFVGLASLTTGGSTTIALAAFVYTHGVAGIWLDLAGVLGLTLLGLLLAGRIRREGAITLPEIIGRYYGAGARRAAGGLVLVSEIAWFALLVTATQVVLSAALGVSALPAIIGATAVFVAYTALGGHFAVVRTDLLQYGLMVVGILGVGLWTALAGAGGLKGLPAAAWSFPTSETLPARDVLALLVLVGLPHLVGSDISLKLLSCRDERTARRASLFAAISKLAFGAAVAAIALAARKALPPLAAESALPAAITAFAPPALAALVMVSLVATMQTSVDTILLSATAVTVRDLAPGLAERGRAVATARLLTPLYGAMGLLVALAFDRKVVEVLKLGYSIFAAGLILPVLVALLPWRLAARPRGAIAAMIAGGAVAAVGRFFPSVTGGIDPVLAGTGVNLVLLFVSLRFARPAPGTGREVPA